MHSALSDHRGSELLLYLHRSRFASFVLDDNADPALPNTIVSTISGADFGVMTITEGAAPGYSLTDITCSEGTDFGSTATVQVDAGDDITCTVTNTQNAS